MKKGLVLSVAVLISGLVSAQNDSLKVDTDTLIKKNFQLSVITPVGTNGMDYGKVENKISINLYAGHHGGLNGVEFGGFINSIKRDATGLQMAGFGNVVQGNLKGAQFAGTFNYASQVKGTQFSGFANIAKGSVDGVQASGFANYAHGDHKGVQYSGFANGVKGNATGFYAAGFTNIALGKVKGVQASGFLNGAHKGINGLQLGNFLNYSLGTVEGGQISGFANFTKTLKGFQVGLLNYTDSIDDGIMVGLLSYARNGYHTLEFESNESLYGNISYKTGMKKFYNILTMGMKPNKENLFWSVGYGVGTQMHFTPKFGMNLDLTVNHLNKGDVTTSLNMLTKLKANAFYQFHPKLTVYGGPSVNLLVTDLNNQGEATESEGFINHAIYDKNSGGVNTKLYLGFQGGIRF